MRFSASSLYFLLFFVVNACAQPKDSQAPPAPSSVGSGEYWLTTPDQSALLQKQNDPLVFYPSSNQQPLISVNIDSAFQTMEGFGFCVTGGSAWLINSLSPSAEDALLNDLFSTTNNGIGVSYIRISIGSSDLDSTVFSYDDLPVGATDTALTHFSIAPDMTNLVPVLKKILTINPSIKILASPWCAPAWMTTNGLTTKGSLKHEYYNTYARYLVKYLQAMKQQGINIDAITLQNEPLNPNNNPAMVMQPEEQRDFIKTAVGPQFVAAGINTKIILYDHNCDRPDYPMTILSDPDAAKYVDGSAFHLYGGDISALTTVHNAYPKKHVYFTEQWVGAPGNFAENLSWHVEHLIIGAPRNWSRNVLEWNLASDPLYKPHTPGGCTECLGAITVGTGIKKNVAYYIIAHASKFVRTGSVRVASSLPDGLPNVAFRTPDGKTVLIVLNNSNTAKDFFIGDKSKAARAHLLSGAVATYIW